MQKDTTQHDNSRAAGYSRDHYPFRLAYFPAPRWGEEGESWGIEMTSHVEK